MGRSRRLLAHRGRSVDREQLFRSGIGPASHEPIKRPLDGKEQAALEAPRICTGHLSASLDGATGPSRSREPAPHAASVLLPPILGLLVLPVSGRHPREAPQCQKCYQQLHTRQPRCAKSLPHPRLAPLNSGLPLFLPLLPAYILSGKKSIFFSPVNIHFTTIWCKS